MRRRMGVAGALKVTTQFDWEAKVDRMQEVYAFSVGSGAKPDWSA